MDDRTHRNCPECTAKGVVKMSQVQTFLYGTVEIATIVPTWRCQNPECGFAFTDEQGEQARHEAVCRYLGRLTPAEIQEIRGDRTFYEMARLIGSKDVPCWERGTLIQSEEHDRILRGLATKGKTNESGVRAVDR